MKPVFDRDKFKAAIHYLCHHADRDFGRIKLHKALYFATSGRPQGISNGLSTS